MSNQTRCQSCGMRLMKNYFGTDLSGHDISDFCINCYQKGQFTEPNLTLNEMIQLSIKNMTEDLHFPIEKASFLANDIIPKLKRWRLI